MLKLGFICWPHISIDIIIREAFNRIFYRIANNNQIRESEFKYLENIRWQKKFKENSSDVEI